MIKAFVDRIEEDIAVVISSDDPKVQFDLPLRYLPGEIKPGDHVTIQIELDPADMADTLQNIKNLQQDLTQDNNPNQTHFKL